MDEQISIATYQSVRYRNAIVQFETVTLNGIECLFLEDVRQRFPTVTSLCIENTQITFLRNENGQRLEPQRIKAYKDVLIDAFDPEEQCNDDIYTRIDRLDKNVHDIQKTVDLIHINSQETLITTRQAMTQNYELHEYTTPRYFYILPIEESNRGVLNSVKGYFQHQYKLYFLCDCSDNPTQRHVALHEGYVVKKPKEFIVKYGPHLRTTLGIVRILLGVGISILPLVDNIPGFTETKSIPRVGPSTTISVNNQLDMMTAAIREIETTAPPVDTSQTTTSTSQKTALHGAELRELENYLENVDTKKSLGNLHRMISDDGHVRWVCLEHYDTISFNNKLSENIHQFEAFGGTFNRETKEAVIEDKYLTSDHVTILCNLLKKGFTFAILKFVKCSLKNTTDLDQLFDVTINRSSICRVDISDLTVQSLIGSPKCICKYMSIHTKDHVVEIQAPRRYQNIDLKIFPQLWSQSKIRRVFRIHGFEDFPNDEKTFCGATQTTSDSKILSISHLHNIEFLNILLTNDFSISQLKLNFCFSSPTIMINLCQTLKKNQTLLELDIMSYTSFDNEQVMIELMKSLRNHKSLKKVSLFISDIKLSDEKERCLIDLLLNDSFISCLCLSNCFISHELTEALIKASESIKPYSFTSLELYRYQMDDADKSKLQLQHTEKKLANLLFSKEQYWCKALNKMRYQFQQGKYRLP
ncbi:unnamed protein product [Adineta steineri]|uniref:Uncharacterized protein n=1 Tax=Adineta steineri TaxID=433720 RepID=A0A814H238_9BILA|nr:unnamed protein product [Adineta steineri]CAF1009545.1 unnamed protein product [Adineta steineri]CAF3557418.1 unnamed protein product [Adineta steineri]CAF4132105.1 unnamed protein product [Adineta steineri]